MHEPAANDELMARETVAGCAILETP